MAISGGYGENPRQSMDHCPRCGYYEPHRYDNCGRDREIARLRDEMRYMMKEIMYNHARVIQSQYLLKPEKSMKLTALAKRILDPETRVLVEAGWLNSDLSLTAEGRDAFLAHYLQANKKELAAEATKRVEEKKEEEKDC